MFLVAALLVLTWFAAALVGAALLLWSVVEFGWLFLNRRGFGHSPQVFRKHQFRAVASLVVSLFLLFGSAGVYYYHSSK